MWKTFKSLFESDDENDSEYEEELRDDIEDRMRDNIVEMYSPLFDQLRPFLSSSKKIKAISTEIYLYEDEGSNLKDLKSDAKRRVRLASRIFSETGEICRNLSKKPTSEIQHITGSSLTGIGIQTCIYSNFLDKKVLNQLSLFQEIYEVEFTPKNALTKELNDLKELEDEISFLNQILKNKDLNCD